MKLYHEVHGTGAPLVLVHDDIGALLSELSIGTADFRKLVVVSASAIVPTVTAFLDAA
jgi:hypothetical protein